MKWGFYKVCKVYKLEYKWPFDFSVASWHHSPFPLLPFVTPFLLARPFSISFLLSLFLLVLSLLRSLSSTLLSALDAVLFLDVIQFSPFYLINLTEATLIYSLVFKQYILLFAFAICAVSLKSLLPFFLPDKFLILKTQFNYHLWKI